MKNIRSIQLHGNEFARLAFHNGRQLRIHFNEDSGNELWRYKVDTITKVKHPGIYLGYSYETQKHYVVHNHYKLFGTAGISTLEEFAAGQEVSWNGEASVNHPFVVVKKALNHVLRKERYNTFSFNCQTFTSDSRNNVRKSHDVEKWKGVGFFGLLFVSAIALFDD